MAQLYVNKIHVIEHLLRTLTDRIAVLHGAIHQFREATLMVQRHVPGSYHVEYDVHEDGNEVILASL